MKIWVVVVVVERFIDVLLMLLLSMIVVVVVVELDFSAVGIRRNYKGEVVVGVVGVVVGNVGGVVDTHRHAPQ